MSVSISCFHTRTLLVEESGVPSMVFLPLLLTTSLMKEVTTTQSLTTGVTVHVQDQQNIPKLILEPTSL